MIRFSCPGCKTALEMGDDVRGTVVACPRCSKKLRVPAAAETSLAKKGAAPTRSDSTPADSLSAAGERSQVKRGDAAADNTQIAKKRAGRADAEATWSVPLEDDTPNEATWSVPLEDGKSSAGSKSGEGTWSVPVGDSTSAGPSAEAASSQELTSLLGPPQQADEIGRLGPYRVLKILGSGGMGAVFLAQDLGLERLVALKIMLPAFASSAAAKQRFLREARLAAAVKHDNIATIYQVGEERGVPYLAMELLDGESLDQCLRRRGKLSAAEVLGVGRQIAQGLEAANKRGLIHRDIKPANIWLEADSQRVKILDFGLARAVDDDVHLTQSGAVVGTPAYMAPEQASADAVDHRGDLFSLGCVLYRLATGELPFKGKTAVATLLAMATQHPDPPSDLNPEIPPELSDLILHLLAKNPADRPGTAQAVVDALTALQAGQDTVVQKQTAAKSPRKTAAAAKKQTVANAGPTSRKTHAEPNRSRPSGQSSVRPDPAAPAARIKPVVLWAMAAAVLAAATTVGIVVYFGNTPQAPIASNDKDPKDKGGKEKEPKDPAPITGKDPKDPGPITGKEKDPKDPGPITGMEKNPKDPGPITGKEKDPKDPGPITGKEKDPKDPGPITGKEKDPKDPGPTTGKEKDPKDPGPITGKEKDPKDPGPTTGKEKDPKDPGPITGKEKDPKDPGPITGKEKDPKDPGPITGKEKDPKDPGPITGKEKDPKDPGPITGKEKTLPIEKEAPLITTSTNILGGAFDPEFKDEAPRGGLLIGFECGLFNIFNKDSIKSIRPIYRLAKNEEIKGKQFGATLSRVVTVKAKDGYAVGSISVKAGLWIDGMTVTFMRVADGRLNPRDSYQSDFVGGQGGGQAVVLGGDGSPAVGIVGKNKQNNKFKQDECTGLGLLLTDKIQSQSPPPRENGKRIVDLIPLIDVEKDQLRGNWLISGKFLKARSIPGGQKIQMPYQPPQEYDYIVSFSQETPRQGVALIMPNPNGGSFFFMAGGFVGDCYFYSQFNKKLKKQGGQITPGTLHTVVIKVRRDQVEAVMDGKVLITHKTDFKELGCDDWRELLDRNVLGIYCDDPTVFQTIQVVEITGTGKQSR